MPSWSYRGQTKAAGTAGWFAGCCLAGLMALWLAAWPVGCLGGRLACWLACYLGGWLILEAFLLADSSAF